MKESSRLRRRQLDRLLHRSPGFRAETPKGGWIKAVRQALGCSGAALARRMGVTLPTLYQLEENEERGATSLKTLDRAAKAIGCKLVYTIVPVTGTFEETVRQQALRCAEKHVSAVDSSMRLEAQGVDPIARKQQVEDLADELVRRLPRYLWDDVT